MYPVALILLPNKAWEEMVIPSQVATAKRAKIMAIAVTDDQTPTIVNSQVKRIRDYLTQTEIERLIEAARKTSRYGHRDAP